MIERSTAAKAASYRLGFTLVEMLVVMGIMVILLTLVVPATVTLSRDRSVQVRLCRPNGGQYTAIMPLYVSTTMSATGAVTQTYTAVSKPASLPTAVIIDAGSKLSAILNPVGVATNPVTPSITDPPLGNQGTNYQYVAFQFKPDGSTDLLSQTSPSPDGLWFLTVHNATDGDSLQNAPANYYAIKVDAYNGHVQQFRP